MALSEIMVGDYKPQFQWGHTLITEDNAEKYQTLPDALKHIRREMETDLVTEYMKKESDHDIFFWIALVVSVVFLVLAAALFVAQWTIYSRVEATMCKLWGQESEA